MSYKLRKRTIEHNIYERNEYDKIKNIEDLINISKLKNPPKKFSHSLITKLKHIQPHLIELNEMVGLATLKHSIFLQIIYYLQNMNSKEIENDYLNTVIYGEPGSGKTQVACIIGKIFASLGVLKNRSFTVAHRQDLVGEFLGQTALKTHLLLSECKGGVIFIDEIYSLGTSTSNNKDTFSKEAIDTLNVFLSENKDLCCIIAGYKNEVDELFFGANKGLERRFPWIHTINKYTSSELYEILIRKIQKINWSFSFNKDDVVKIINSNSKYFKNAGGDIENLLSKMKIYHSQRIFNESNKKEKFILSIDDLKQTIEHIKNERGNVEIPKTYENMFL